MEDYLESSSSKKMEAETIFVTMPNNQGQIKTESVIVTTPIRTTRQLFWASFSITSGIVLFISLAVSIFASINLLLGLFK